MNLAEYKCSDLGVAILPIETLIVGCRSSIGRLLIMIIMGLRLGLLSGCRIVRVLL